MPTPPLRPDWLPDPETVVWTEVEDIMPTISCAVICRDNQDTIGRLLASVRPHVDELVVVDTGSVDETRSIAQQYADILVGFQWVDDFSAARQYALDQCTSDWVIWLDSDDELIGGETLRDLVSQAPEDVAMYLMRYETDHSPEGTVRHEFWRERIFRRGAARWIGRAHEVLVPYGQDKYERFSGAYVVHHGHNTPQQSLQRNIRLLELDLQEKPDDTRTLFYLGRDLVTLGELDRGRDVLQRYLEVAVWPDEAFVAAQLVGFTYRSQQRYQDAYMADLRMLGIHPLWPQGYFALAEDCYYLQKWEWSHHWSEIGQSLPKPDTNLFQAPENLESGWMIYETIALYQLGRLAEAAQLTARALHLLPNDPHHVMNARYFTLKLREQQEKDRAELEGLLRDSDLATVH